VKELPREGNSILHESNKLPEKVNSLAGIGNGFIFLMNSFIRIGQQIPKLGEWIGRGREFNTGRGQSIVKRVDFLPLVGFFTDHVISLA
jgi:hypothetical protein